jgi:hypothetical protein
MLDPPWPNQQDQKKPSWKAETNLFPGETARIFVLSFHGDRPIC